VLETRPGFFCGFWQQLDFVKSEYSIFFKNLILSSKLKPPKHKKIITNWIARRKLLEINDILPEFL